MVGPSVTIDTTMFAAAIRIDAGREADVRAVVISDQRLRAIDEQFGLRVGLRVLFEAQSIKSAGRIRQRTASFSIARLHHTASVPARVPIIGDILLLRFMSTRPNAGRGCEQAYLIVAGGKETRPLRN